MKHEVYILQAGTYTLTNEGYVYRHDSEYNGIGGRYTRLDSEAGLQTQPAALVVVYCAKGNWWQRRKDWWTWRKEQVSTQKYYMAAVERERALQELQRKVSERESVWASDLADAKRRLAERNQPSRSVEDGVDKVSN